MKVLTSSVRRVVALPYVKYCKTVHLLRHILVNVKEMSSWDPRIYCKQTALKLNLNLLRHRISCITNATTESLLQRLTVTQLWTRRLLLYRAVCEVRELILLLRVGTLWMCGDGFFFEVPPLASDIFLTTLHPLLENTLQTVCRELQEEKPRNRMRRDLNWILCSAWKKWIGGTPLEHPPDLAPCDFWAFPTMKRELRGKKFQSDQRSAARFREVGGAL
jgi:hypothetical protein